MEDLATINQRALKDHIEEIRSAPEGSEILGANKDLLADRGSTTWPGGGTLTLGGFIWWTASCNLVLTDFSSGAKAVHFSASGTGFMVGAIDSEAAGAFVVDPKSIGGKCHFRIVSGAYEAGAVTLFLYGKDGKFYGNFTGIAEGLGGGTTSGTGKLVVIST